MNYPDITPEELDLIEQYLARQLSPAEQAAFEQRLAGDVALQEKVSHIQLLATGIQEAKVEALLNEIHPQGDLGRQQSKVVSMFSWKKIAAVAAVLLIAGGAIWWFVGRPSAEERLFSRYFTPDAGLATTMGTPNAYTFEKAMVDYKTGNYGKAIGAWNQLLQANPTSDTLNYFIGSAMLADKKYTEAIGYFEKVRQHTGSAFRDDANWYTGLALLRTGQGSKAKQFISISKHPKAAELLERIK